MKYSIYCTAGFYCNTNSSAIAYNICKEYIQTVNPLEFERLKNELDITYYNNIHSFGVMGYIWAEDGDKYARKMGG